MISYNFDTGQLICNANIKEVEQFIKDMMGRLNRIHCGSKSQASQDPPNDALRKNTNSARWLGIKNHEGWLSAVRNNKLEYWHYYTEENNKVIPSPFKENNE